MDLRQMEYLVALADEQHFTRAAAVCGVSQSGLSAAIRGLETELGSVLFTRTTRRVEPTDAGLALLPYPRELDAAVVASTDHLGALDRVEIGRRPILLVCPPDHPLAAQAKADWTDLEGLEY